MIPIWTERINFFVGTPELVFRREVVVGEYISRRPCLYVAIVWSSTPLVMWYHTKSAVLTAVRGCRFFLHSGVPRNTQIQGAVCSRLRVYVSLFSLYAAKMPSSVTTACTAKNSHICFIANATCVADYKCDTRCRQHVTYYMCNTDVPSTFFQRP